MEKGKKGLMALALAANIILTSGGCTARKIEEKQEKLKQEKEMVTVIDSPYQALLKEIEEKENLIAEKETTINNIKLESGYTACNELAYVTWADANVYTDYTLNVLKNPIKGYQVVKRVSNNGHDSCVILEDGSVGYMLNQCLETLPKSTGVIFDLSDQKAQIMDNYEEKFNCYIKSGKDETPTPCGYSQIWCEYGPEDKFIMQGSYGDYPVKYALGLGTLVYFHTSNDNDYGTEAYHTTGSHMCIRGSEDSLQNACELLDTGDWYLIKK